MAIEPKTKADREKMGESLGRLVEEDPTLTVKTNEETGQTIIAGMGELHLDIIMDRMRREFNVETNAGAPQIAYRESITKPSEGEGKLVKQSGGRGQYGHVVVDMMPQERGKGIAIENKVVGGNIPKEYIPACKKGIEEALLNGVVNGSPVIDVAINITDGSYHEVDSNELAFKLAAIFAVQDAMKKAGPILLEPIMKVEVSTPDEFQGDIIGDLEPPSRQDHEHGKQEQDDQRARRSAALGNVRLRQQHPFHVQGPRRLHHGAVALRTGPRADRRADHRTEEG